MKTTFLSHVWFLTSFLSSYKITSKQSETDFWQLLFFHVFVHHVVLKLARSKKFKSKVVFNLLISTTTTTTVKIIFFEKKVTLGWARRGNATLGSIWKSKLLFYRNNQCRYKRPCTNWKEVRSKFISSDLNLEPLSYLSNTPLLKESQEY